MKNTFLLMALVVISTVTVAQQKHIARAVAKPSIVKPTQTVLQGFNEKYPESTLDLNWEITPGGNFIAQFELNGYKQFSAFSPEGKWLQTRAAYSLNQLPEAVRNAIQEKYPNAEFQEAYKITMDQVPVFYKVTLIKDKDGWIVWVNDAGIIKE